MGEVLNTGDSLTTGQSLNSSNGAYAVTLQDDGNLVLTDQGNPVWSTKTDGKGAVRLTVQDDGNVVLYNAENVGVWSTRTDQAGAQLILQDDRNLVVYAAGEARWSSGTATEAPAPAAEAAPEPVAVRTHTVVEGDTLWAIAEQALGDGNRYQEIANLNNIPDPDLINPGQVLTLP